MRAVLNARIEQTDRNGGTADVSERPVRPLPALTSALHRNQRRTQRTPIMSRRKRHFAEAIEKFWRKKTSNNPSLDGCGSSC